MSKKITVIALCLSLGVATLAQADTCKNTHAGLNFRQVVLGLNGGGVRCDYGKDFDFEHSYTIAGNFKPVSGPWGGASDPFTVFCKSTSSNCVFA